MKVAELIAELGLEVDHGSFTAGEKAIEGVKHALEAFAIFEGVKTLKEWVEHTAEAADQAVKTAQRLGTTAEAVQELGYVAQLSDVSMGTLTGSMQKLERRLDQLGQKGKGPAADALRRLGISAKELSALPIDQKLERIADGFADLDPKVAKVPLAQQLGLGPSLIPMLKDGGDGIRELREEARMLGLVIDQETAEAFEAWNDDITRVKGAVQGLKNDAVVALLPVLREMTTSLFEWIKANRELIKQRLEQVMRFVVNAALGLAKAIAKVYEIFEKVVPVITEVVGALGDLLGISQDTGSEIETIALAIGAAWALANLPLLIMIGLVGAALLVIDDLWSGLQGGDSVTKELLQAFEDSLGDSGAGRVVLALKASFEALFKFIKEKIEWLEAKGRAIGETFYNLVHGDEKFQINAANGILPGQPKFVQDAIRREQGIDEVRVAQPGIDAVEQAPDRKRGQLGMYGVDAINQASIVSVQNPSLTDQYANLPVGPSMPAVNVVAPQLHVEVHVQGNADANALDASLKQIEDYFNGALRDAQIAAGARGGKIP
jgi:hypothetical protein